MKKIFKRLGIMLMSSVIIMQTAALASEEIAETKSYTRAQNVVSALEIMKGDENGNFNPDENITRGDFALVIARTLGLDSVNIYDSGYSDVVKGSEYAAAIAVLSQMKIFNGYENGRFYPNEPLQYEQAMKIMVSALGYGFMAENAGGFPAGYLTYAHQLKLTKDIAATSGDTVVRGMAAQLIYNALDVKLMIESGYGDSYTYEKTGDTLLTKYHDTIEIKGIVTQTEYTGLAKVEGTAKKQIAINDTVYECGDLDVQELLGHKVKAYAIENDGEIIYISSDVKAESIITLESEVIMPETTKNQIVYDADGKEEKLDISGASVIFNGRLARTYDNSDFKPASGTVELIDADGNEIYEVVKITSYKNMIVSGGGLDAIYFENGNEPIKIEKAKLIKKAVFETEEGVFDISEYNSRYFPQHSVVSMAKSKDGQMIYMKVSEQRIVGNISSVDEDGMVYIFGEKYEIDAECTNRIANGELTLELGKEYTFTFDFMGKIARFGIQGGAKYGYLINCAPENEMSARLIVRMLIPGGTSGELKNFYASDKIKINGVPYKNNLSAFTELYNAGKIKRQILRYKTNDNGEITTIETALNKLDDAAYMAAKSDDYTANDRFELDAKYGNEAYRGYGCETLESTEFKINGHCSHLFIAYDGDVDEKLYKAYTGVSAVYRPDTYPNGTSYIYDVNENWAATAIVLEKSGGSSSGGGTSSIDKNTGLTLVEKVVACLTSDGEPTIGIVDEDGNIIPAEDDTIKDEDGGWNSSYAGVYLKDIVPGSIIQTKKNAYDEIAEVRIVYMPGMDTGWFEQTSGDGVIPDRAYALSVIAYGKVVKITPDGYLIYNANGTWDDIKDRDKAWDRNRTVGGRILMFDSEKKVFISIPRNEIQPNDTVFTHVTNGHWMFLSIIYR